MNTAKQPQSGRPDALAAGLAREVKGVCHAAELVQLAALTGRGPTLIQAGAS